MGDFENRPLRIRVRASGTFGGGPVGPGLAIGLFLIVAGALLFLDNLNILPFEAAGLIWPLALGLYSLAVFVRTRSAAAKVWAGAGMAAGVLLVLGDLHILRVTGAILWPLALIATGVVMLIYRLRLRDFGERLRPERFTVGSSTEAGSSGGRLQETAIFSSVKRRVESGGFEGAELNSVFGGIELDLRWATITTPNRTAVIEANAVFGGIEIRVPETWRVNVQGHAIFGAYEDKTLRPRGEPGLEIPTLIVRGGTAFGGVSLKN